MENKKIIAVELEKFQQSSFHGFHKLHETDLPSKSTWSCPCALPDEAHFAVFLA